MIQCTYNISPHFYFFSFCPARPLQIAYEGRRRFRLLQVEAAEGAYTAVAEFYADTLDGTLTPDEAHSLDALEFQVWQALLEVQRLTLAMDTSAEGAAAAAAADVGASLPSPLVCLCAITLCERS